MPRERKSFSDAAPAASELPLHLKYRPKTFTEVIGQRAIVESLKEALGSRTRPHAYLFSGPGGTGKTTLARLVATAVGVSAEHVLEVDAASNSGIDAMRELVKPLGYQGFGGAPNKMVILDEAHGLSKQAFDALLKTLEEPPAHVYFALCTTNVGKITPTIVSRCASYALRPCNSKELLGLLDKVCEAEGFDTSNAVLDAILDACDGSPRKALTALAKVHACKDAEDAYDLLETVAEDKEIIDLCRLVISRELTWKKLREVIGAMPSPEAESIRITISCYLAACIGKARGDAECEDLCDIAHQFRMPYNSSDKLMPLWLSFDSLLRR